MFESSAQKKLIRRGILNHIALLDLKRQIFLQEATDQNITKKN
jgi:hypothetical protein